MLIVTQRERDQDLLGRVGRPTKVRRTRRPAAPAPSGQQGARARLLVNAAPHEDSVLMRWIGPCVDVSPWSLMLRAQADLAHPAGSRRPAR